jgi:hypothetical protein
MEENLMEDFKIFYDEEEDILYLGKEGKEEELWNFHQGSMSKSMNPVGLSG